MSEVDGLEAYYSEEELKKLRIQIDSRLDKMDTSENRKKAQRKFADKVNNMPDAEFNRRMLKKGGWDDFGKEERRDNE